MCLGMITSNLLLYGAAENIEKMRKMKTMLVKGIPGDTLWTPSYPFETFCQGNIINICEE